ncbi:hypothetical protein [Oscillatoria acuminata]|nr:hypothetical protein [Oscillatoria acuminata]
MKSEGVLEDFDALAINQQLVNVLQTERHLVDENQRRSHWPCQ